MPIKLEQSVWKEVNEMEKMEMQVEIDEEEKMTARQTVLLIE